MKISLLTIGDELLIGQILNTNIHWLSQQLTDLGIEVVNHLTVSDQESEIKEALQFLIPKNDALIIGGGLGPTHDDLTMEALSQYFNLPLEYDADWISKVEAFFKTRNRVMSENNKKQGLLLKGATRIDNDCGTAAGQHFHSQDTEIFVVPGVPHEMKSMMTRYILPILAKENPQERILKRTLLTSGPGESLLATRCDPFVQKVKARSDLTLAFLPSVTQVKLRLQMKAKTKDAEKEFELLVNELKALCGIDFFGFEPSTLEEIILEKLKSTHSSLALAESCTGGLIAHRLTQIPGCSLVLKGGVVAYQNEIKEGFLGISSEDIKKNGVVSEWTVRAMADSIRKKWNTTYSIATTGYLGPDGGDEHAPAGTIWVAVSTPEETEARVIHVESDRERGKERSAQAALDLLRRIITL